MIVGGGALGFELGENSEKCLYQRFRSIKKIPFEFLLSSSNVSEANKSLKSNESANSFENAFWSPDP